MGEGRRVGRVGPLEPQALGEGNCSFFAWGAMLGGLHFFPECWKHRVAKSLAVTLEPHSPSCTGHLTVCKNGCFSHRSWRPQVLGKGLGRSADASLPWAPTPR